MASAAPLQVTLRPATAADAVACGKICYAAFSAINAQHNFPCDFPSEDVAIAAISMMFAHPDFYCVVAEAGGRIVGSNCMDERSIIAGIGPITVDLAAQNLGAGRKLMQDAMDRANSRHASGVRLVQAAFHNRSLSLYTSLGFDIREPLACVQGQPRERQAPGCTVRLARTADIPACAALSLRIHGFDRSGELPEAIANKMAVVVERAGRVSGYSSTLGFFGHTTAETNLDLQALIAWADSFAGPGILIPTRNTAILRWCLSNGLKIVQPMTLMSVGLYNEPAGAWCPSISF